MRKPPRTAATVLVTGTAPGWTAGGSGVSRADGTAMRDPAGTEADPGVSQSSSKTSDAPGGPDGSHSTSEGESPLAASLAAVGTFREVPMVSIWRGRSGTAR